MLIVYKSPYGFQTIKKKKQHVQFQSVIPQAKCYKRTVHFNFFEMDPVQLLNMAEACGTTIGLDKQIF